MNSPRRILSPNPTQNGHMVMSETDNEPVNDNTSMSARDQLRVEIFSMLNAAIKIVEGRRSLEDYRDPNKRFEDDNRAKFIHKLSKTLKPGL